MYRALIATLILASCSPESLEAELHQQALTYSTPYGSSAVDVAVGKRSGTNDVLLIYRRKSDNNCTVHTLATGGSLVNTTANGSTANDSMYLAGNTRTVGVYCSNGGTTYTLVAASNASNAIVELKGSSGDDGISCWSENGICHAWGGDGDDWLDSRAGLTGAGYRNKIYGEGGHDIAMPDLLTDIDMGSGDDCVDNAVAMPSASTGGTGYDRMSHLGSGTCVAFEYAGGRCYDPAPAPPHPVHSSYCCIDVTMNTAERIEATGCVDLDLSQYDDCADYDPELETANCDGYDAEVLIVSGEDAGDLVCQEN